MENFFVPWLLLYLSRGVFLYSCFGNDGYTSNGLLLEALISRHGIALFSVGDETFCCS